VICQYYSAVQCYVKALDHGCPNYGPPYTLIRPTHAFEISNSSRAFQTSCHFIFFSSSPQAVLMKCRKTYICVRWQYCSSPPPPHVPLTRNSRSIYPLTDAHTKIQFVTVIKIPTCFGTGVLSSENYIYICVCVCVCIYIYKPTTLV
jgi:hypothetical protein